MTNIPYLLYCSFFSNLYFYSKSKVENKIYGFHSRWMLAEIRHMYSKYI